MSKYLTKAEIIEAHDIKSEEVTVPEWGGVVLVRGMTGRGRDAFEASIMADDDGIVNYDNIRSKLVSKCIVDEDGTCLFTDADI